MLEIRLTITAVVEKGLEVLESLDGTVPDQLLRNEVVDREQEAGCGSAEDGRRAHDSRSLVGSAGELRKFNNRENGRIIL